MSLFKHNHHVIPGWDAGGLACSCSCFSASRAWGEIKLLHQVLLPEGLQSSYLKDGSFQWPVTVCHHRQWHWHFSYLLLHGDKATSSIRLFFLPIPPFESEKKTTKWGSVTDVYAGDFVLKQKTEERDFSVLRDDKHWGCWSSCVTPLKVTDFSEPLIWFLMRVKCRTRH